MTTLLFFMKGNCSFQRKRTDCRRCMENLSAAGRISRKSVQRISSGSYGMQCIVKRTDVTRGLNLQPVGIEELFVVMVKGDLA